MKKKVSIGLSGGVDSAVSAYLLTQAGFEVTGAYMRHLANNLHSDVLEEAKESEKRVVKICEQLDIPLRVYDLREQFNKNVIKPFLQHYQKGLTPNPCIECNQTIKFGKLMNACLKDGADYFATGHYAINTTTIELMQDVKEAKIKKLVTKYISTQINDDKTNINGNRKRLTTSFISSITLFCAKDKSKDQTYFLYKLSGTQIRNCLFPIAGLLKSEVKEIARRIGVIFESTKESHDICFMGKSDLTSFLKNELKQDKFNQNEQDMLMPAKCFNCPFSCYSSMNEDTAVGPKSNGNWNVQSGKSNLSQSQSRGDFIDVDSKEVVGQHEGAIYFTIGQRKGIRIGGHSKPYYVVDKDLEKNVVYLAQGYNNPVLWGQKVLLRDLLLTGSNRRVSLEAKIQYLAKTIDLNVTGIIRYGTEKVAVKGIELIGGVVEIEFVKQVFAITPGQSLVLYVNDKCVGGGVIVNI